MRRILTRLITPRTSSPRSRQRLVLFPRSIETGIATSKPLPGDRRWSWNLRSTRMMLPQAGTTKGSFCTSWTERCKSAEQGRRRARRRSRISALRHRPFLPVRELVPTGPRQGPEILDRVHACSA